MAEQLPEYTLVLLLFDAMGFIKSFSLHSFKFFPRTAVTVAGQTVRHILTQDTQLLAFITCTQRACAPDMMSIVI